MFPTWELQLLPSTSGGHYNKDKNADTGNCFKVFIWLFALEVIFWVTAHACVKSDQFMQMF